MILTDRYSVGKASEWSNLELDYRDKMAWLMDHDFGQEAQQVVNYARSVAMVESLLERGIVWGQNIPMSTLLKQIKRWNTLPSVGFLESHGIEPPTEIGNQTRS